MEFNATFLAVIISFILFVFIMNKILYAPMRRIAQEREEYIHANIASAEENDKQSESLTNEINSKIMDARENARNRYNEVMDGFKNKKSDIIQEAQNAAKDELEKAHTDLDNVSNDAKNRLKGQLSDLANDIVEKVLGYRSEIQGFNNEAVDRILYSQER